MNKISYELTEHAKKVIAERNIKLEWIELVISSPLKIENDAEDEELEHALGKISEYGNRILRVIYKKGFPKRIVTVYFDRTMKGKL
ncbi:DUF4258 domain-containing protein [Calditrichota bacterium LG25]